MRQWAARVGAGVFVVFAAVVAVNAYRAMSAAPSDNTASQAPAGTATCTPAPCTDLQGYTLWVSNVRIEGKLVHMTVMFKNSSSSTHAAPEDLALVDQGNRTSQITTSGADCSTFTRHEFSHGQTLGPINICFHVNDTTPPFRLVWSPDMGAFCCETGLLLNPS